MRLHDSGAVVQARRHRRGRAAGRRLADDGAGHAQSLPGLLDVAPRDPRARRSPGEKDAKLAQGLGQLQPLKANFLGYFI